MPSRRTNQVVCYVALLSLRHFINAQSGPDPLWIKANDENVRKITPFRLPHRAMWLVSELTAPGVALIWPAPALDPDGLLRAFAALIVACVVATLPRRWRVAGTAALVVALVFFALR
jgi:hypothetical protein